MTLQYCWWVSVLRVPLTAAFPALCGPFRWSWLLDLVSTVPTCPSWKFIIYLILISPLIYYCGDKNVYQSYADFWVFSPELCPSLAVLLIYFYHFTLFYICLLFLFEFFFRSIHLAFLGGVMRQLKITVIWIQSIRTLPCPSILSSLGSCDMRLKYTIFYEAEEQ